MHALQIQQSLCSVMNAVSEHSDFYIYTAFCATIFLSSFLVRYMHTDAVR